MWACGTPLVKSRVWGWTDYSTNNISAWIAKQTINTCGKDYHDIYRTLMKPQVCFPYPGNKIFRVGNLITSFILCMLTNLKWITKYKAEYTLSVSSGCLVIRGWQQEQSIVTRNHIIWKLMFLLTHVCFRKIVMLNTWQSDFLEIVHFQFWQYTWEVRWKWHLLMMPLWIVVH